MNIITYFQQLTQIPHCSHKSEALQTFLVDFAQKRGYQTKIDKTGNILVFKGNPRLSLQAHYDMVCVGKAPQIKTFIKDGWMQAEIASLGADNGMAIAMMMALMDEGRECEYLFTADEEVGLIGANALQFPLQSKYMLNLDSEDEAEVYIGCAGGVDIFAHKHYTLTETDQSFYEILVSGLPGGHSGVDIDKNIPNAIKLFASYCKDKDIHIVSVEAGERINSIPVHVKAVVATSQSLVPKEHIHIRELHEKHPVISQSREIVDLIDHFQNGVLAFHEELGIPDRSINLALLKIENGLCEIAASARAMDQEGLETVEERTKDFFIRYGYDVKSEGKYPAWKPEINRFSEIVCEKTKEVFPSCEYKAIHAGLECAVISNLYPHIKIASIGPNIRSPHSVSERVEIASVQKVYQVVRKVIDVVENS
jgi:dipeptidase D